MRLEDTTGLLTVGELAKIIKKSRSLIYYYIFKRRLKHYKVEGSNKVFVTLEDWNDFRNSVLYAR